jgi:hypothetical protein
VYTIRRIAAIFRSFFAALLRRMNTARVKDDEKHKGEEMEQRTPLEGILGLLHEIQTCRDAGAISASVIMVFVAIDVMAFLSMPTGQKCQYGSDFIKWVDKYLKTEVESPYQYDGRDVYGARCAMVHTYSAESEFHQKNAPVKRFGYHDGGQHHFNENIDKDTVVIGVNSLILDFSKAVEAFVQDMILDVDLRERVATRVQKIVQVFPLSY